MVQPLWVVISPIKTMYQNHPGAHWPCRLVPEDSHHHRGTKEKPRGGKQPTLCLILPLPHLGSKPIWSSCVCWGWLEPLMVWGALDLGDWCILVLPMIFWPSCPPRNSMQWLCKKSRTVFWRTWNRANKTRTLQINKPCTARKEVVSAVRFPLKILSS